eukprot:TRINITY_DN11498_c0_g2_i1.p1 TRINITY_DN11498_c0_g2~~TRINITY_DN11498_c0_g2_i1.p1  ORF type:complete len:471 (+),score=113.54 TRINITY_DN11498_c0_g2_i1:3-1415(+)
MEEIRVTVFGAGGVGKSAICTQFSIGTFLIDYAYDCGLCDFTKHLQLPSGKQIRAELLDTSGAEDLTSLFDLHCRQTTHAMLVFSITSLASFNEIVPSYYERLLRYKPAVSAVLIGNKSDLEEFREVSKEQGLLLASSLGCEYFETSAKSGYNINEAVVRLVDTTIPPFDCQKDFCSMMASDLGRIFNTAALSDLVIIVEDKNIYLHKTIVCARLPTFLEFFDKSGTFTPKGIPYDHLLVLTQWIYTGIFHSPYPESIKSSIVALNMFPLIPLLDQTDPPTKSISFSIFFNESTLSDIQIVVEKKTFFAHKVILACRSQYFNTMFTTGFKETNVETLKLKEVTVPIFEELLRYIYNDQMNINQVNWQDLLMAGQKYNIPGVVDHVGKFLMEQMTWENVVEMYKICLAFPNLDYLLEKVKHVVGYYHPLVIHSPSFKKLDKEKQEFLNTMKIPGNWDYPKIIPEKGNCILQ